LGWTAWQTFADVGSNTYSSQTNYILDYGGGNIMYMGDRWVSSNLQSSTYVWLPLNISGATVTMKNYASWIPNADVSSSSWSTSPDSTSYEGEKATYSGGARDVSCSSCSGGKAAGYIGGSDNGKVTFTGIAGPQSSGITTVTIKYNNGDTNPRYAQVTVNGGTPIKLAFEHNGSSPSISTLNVVLSPASNNTLVFEGVNGGWGPDIDRLLVPVQ
jgi:hypothetical protein